MTKGNPNLRIVQIVRKGDAGCSDEPIDSISYENPDEIDLMVLKDYGGVILDCGDASGARAVLRRIRSLEAGNIYLKPVYLWSLDEIKDQYLLSIGDGEAGPYLRKLMPSVRRINEKTAKLEPLKADSNELNVAIRLMRFLYTRERTLEPVIDSSSRTGYAYPMVTVNFSAEEEHKAFDVLEFCEKERHLTGSYVDRVHLCDRCFSSFLNFREVCVKCGSSDLVVEDLVHHFTCAYMGPESDFGGGESMACPKCDRNLKHIGVDYDKPSSIYTCNNCDENFQDSKIKVFCFHCSREMFAENLVEKKVKRYKLSTKGELSAIYGIKVSMSGIIKFEGMVDANTFRTITNYEIQRSRRVSRPNCLAYLQFRNFQEMYLRGAVKEKIFVEIVKLIKESVRPSDVISYLNEATLIFLFTDTPPDGAKVPIERLRSNLVGLIKDNFSGFTPEINADISVLDGNTDPDALLNGIPAI